MHFNHVTSTSYHVLSQPVPFQPIKRILSSFVVPCPRLMLPSVVCYARDLKIHYHFVCFITLCMKIYDWLIQGCLSYVFQGLPWLIRPLLVWKCNADYDSYNFLFCLNCHWISWFTAEGSRMFSLYVFILKWRACTMQAVFTQGKLIRREWKQHLLFWWIVPYCWIFWRHHVVTASFLSDWTPDSSWQSNRIKAGASTRRILIFQLSLSSLYYG